MARQLDLTGLTWDSLVPQANAIRDWNSRDYRGGFGAKTPKLTIGGAQYVATPYYTYSAEDRARYGRKIADSSAVADTLERITIGDPFRDGWNIDLTRNADGTITQNAWEQQNVDGAFFKDMATFVAVAVTMNAAPALIADMAASSGAAGAAAAGTTAAEVGTAAATTAGATEVAASAGSSGLFDGISSWFSNHSLSSIFGSTAVPESVGAAAATSAGTVAFESAAGDVIAGAVAEATAIEPWAAVSYEASVSAAGIGTVAETGFSATQIGSNPFTTSPFQGTLGSGTYGVETVDKLLTLGQRTSEGFSLGGMTLTPSGELIEAGSTFGAAVEGAAPWAAPTSSTITSAVLNSAGSVGELLANTDPWGQFVAGLGDVSAQYELPKPWWEEAVSTAKDLKEKIPGPVQDVLDGIVVGAVSGAVAESPEIPSAENMTVNLARGAALSPASFQRAGVRFGHPKSKRQLLGKFSGTGISLK